MIFLSAQPDSPYFKWQLEVQFNNFEKIGIDLKDVYALIGWKNSISKEFLEFSKSTKANVIFYEDERIDVKYISSIRPHLIKKFYKDFPNFSNEYCFYHDSDIIFRKLPPFENWMDGKTWSVSDTKSYIGYDYIAEKGIDVLLDMCEVVKISPMLVRQMQSFSGGCQYFLTNVDYEFWNKVERDCELIYDILNKNFEKYEKSWEKLNNRYINTIKSLETRLKLLDVNYTPNSEYNKDFFKYHRIQEWCADMWSVLWNAWGRGFITIIRKELDFSWANTPIEVDDNYHIFHNAGITSEISHNYFFKGKYTNRIPYEDDLTNLSQKTCAKYYIDEIIETGKKLGYNVIEIPQKDFPKVNCVMTTYGRFTCVERSIKCFLEQDYQNKHLLIFNTSPIPLQLGSSLLNKNITIINQQKETLKNKKYTDVGTIREDAFNKVYSPNEIYICWDDDDIYHSQQHISRGVKYLLNSKKVAWKSKQSYFTYDGGNTFDKMNNAFEASVLVWMEYVKEYGFKKSNGDEHSWYKQLVENDKLEDVEILPSYIYVWGEEIAKHKQSGDIENINNFENHKENSQDFGERPLEELEHSVCKEWKNKLEKFYEKN